MNIKALQGLLSSGALPATTLIWTATQPDWQPANKTNLLGNHRTKYKWIKIAAVFFLLLGAGLGYIHIGKNEPTLAILGKIVDYPETQNPVIAKTINTPANIQPGMQRFLDQYNQLQKDYAHLKATFASLQYSTKEKEDDKSLSAATLLKLQAANRTLSEQVEALKIYQTDPLTRTKHAEASRQLAELGEKFLLSEQKNQKLKKELQQNQTKSSPTQQTQLNEKLSKASSELRDKNTRISKLEEQLQALRTTLSKTQNIRPTVPDKPLSHIARVSSVNIKKGIIVFNHGSNTEFSKGDTLRIISKDNEAFLGYAQLRQIFDLKTTANFEGKDISTIKPGDYISP